MQNTALGDLKNCQNRYVEAPDCFLWKSGGLSCQHRRRAATQVNYLTKSPEHLITSIPEAGGHRAGDHDDCVIQGLTDGYKPVMGHCI